MSEFNVPKKEEVSENNKEILDDIEKGLGFVPNLYAYYTKSETALKDYLNLQNRKTSISKREREVINLVVSEYNNCEYCTSAHTVIAGLNGFSTKEILNIRTGNAPFDKKLDSLAQFTLATVKNRGKVNPESKAAFFEAGYTEANLIDIVMTIGDKIMSNFLHNIAGFPVDFPKAEPIDGERA
jgi:uncharacterized peroxidase-related enzyme